MLFIIFNCLLTSILLIFITAFLTGRKNFNRAICENRLLKAQMHIMSRVWKIKIHQHHLTEEDRTIIASLAHKLNFKTDCIYIASTRLIKDWFRKYIGPIFSSCNKKTGRPRISDRVKLLVYRFRKYHKWGYKTIVGKVNDLGHELSKSSIPHILRTFKPDKPGKRFSLLKMSNIFAMDFKVQFNHLGQKFFSLIFISHETREVIHMRNSQGEPSKEWIENQLKEITSDGRQITLIHDNDLRFKHLDFDRYGITSEAIPAFSPNHNAIVERLIGSFKREAIVHYPEFDLKKLNWITKEYFTYYNNYRPHQGIGNITIPRYKKILNGGHKPELSRNLDYAGEPESKKFLDGHLVHYFYKQSA